MRKIFLWMIILTALTAVAACLNTPNQQGGNTPNAAKNAGGKVRIGFSMDTLKEERWQRDKQLIEKRAAELGAELSVTVADGNDDRQNKQVEDLLTKGIDVLIIAPHNAQVAAASVASAKKQGVPVISYDRLVKSDDLDLYVSHQVTKIGEMQAKYALDHAPKGNYIMVYGSSTDNNALLLKDAQLATLKPAIDRGDVKIVAEQFAAEWKAEEALKIVENALTQHRNEVVAVVASNDGTAGGAIQALKGQNLIGKVVVTGQDAELIALQRIAQGEQTMTVYKPIQPLAYGAVDAAIKLAKKESVATTDKIKSVNKEIPSLLFEPKVIDKSNLSDVINDGYHTADEIYKNIPANQRPK
ncbi:MAG: substrate-binding domain-containing protein [Pyrinomonadaceae bacterium]